MNFKPDNRKTTYRMLTLANKKPPKIVFSATALKWIRVLMDEHTTEVGFYAVVDEIGEYEFYIRDVFYPKHDAADGGTCEISPEGEHSIMEYLIEKEKLDDIQRIRFWGHKHPGVRATSPSSQDENQAIERMNSTGAYLIRAICSGDEISISFFDHENQVRFDNIKWEAEDENTAASLVEKMNEVREVLAEASTEENSYDQSVEISKIFSNDDEIGQIKKKVKELKKANIPKNKEYTAYKTTDYKDRVRYTEGKFRQYGKQINFLPNKTSKVTNKPSLNAQEVASLLDEVDQEVDDFYGGGFVE